jgi:hypothetical protein
MKKVIKKHGAKVVAGLAAGIASSLATLASTDAPGTKHKQSNLRKMSGQVSDMLTPASKSLRKRGGKKADGEQRESEERSHRAL